MSLRLMGFENQGFGSYKISDKNQVKSIFKEIEAFPVSDLMIGLVENESYKFALIDQGLNRSALRSIKVGTNAKEMAISFNNGKTEWIGNGSLPDAIIITTKKSERLSYVYLDFDFGNQGRILEAYNIFSCVPSNAAKAFIDIDLDIKTIEGMRFIPTPMENKDLLPIDGRTFENVNPVPLNDQQIEQLRQRTGWTAEKIKKLTIQQQQDSFRQYMTRNVYGYSQQVQKVAADYVKIQFTIQKDNLQYDNYISSFGTNYIIMQAPYYITTQYYNTKASPEQFGKEQQEKNGTIRFYLKNNTDVDIFSFNKQILKNNELNLIVEGFPNGLNAYWVGIEDAIHYIVEVFKVWGAYQYQQFVQNNRQQQQKQSTAAKDTICLDRNTQKLVYITDNKAFEITSTRLILKEQIERERCFFALPHLTQGDYLVRVFAENRQGEIIAKSIPKAIFVRIGQ